MNGKDTDSWAIYEEIYLSTYNLLSGYTISQWESTKVRVSEDPTTYNSHFGCCLLAHCKATLHKLKAFTLENFNFLGSSSHWFFSIKKLYIVV